MRKLIVLFAILFLIIACAKEIPPAPVIDKRMPEKEPILERCVDECLKGEKRCIDNGYQECRDFDGDGCFEWSSAVKCPDYSYCFKGECLKKEIEEVIHPPPAVSCVDECSPHGKKECSGNGYLECGNFDQDPCSEWTFVECPLNNICVNNTCIFQVAPLEPIPFQPICQTDIDCDDSNPFTTDKCINPTTVYANGSSAAQCLHIERLIGDRTFDLLIVEFAPQGINYGNLFYCYDNGRYFFQTLEIWCDDKLDIHNYLEIVNDPLGQIQFNELIESDRSQIPYSLFHINNYFKKEAARYGLNVIPEFNIDLRGPYILDDLPPKTTFSTMHLVDGYFNQKIDNLGIDTSKYDFVAVIYFNDKDLLLSANKDGSNPILSTNDRHKFVNHAGENRRVYLSLDTVRVLEQGIGSGLTLLIHELLHIFGATDSYVGNFAEGGPEWCRKSFECCIDPEGLPEPNKTPKYPQTKGCMMCAGGMIATESGETQPSATLDKIIICPKTAKEIGWQ